jgi:N-methylhydantoinase A
MMSRVGSDIGGTFTDIVVISEDGQTFEIGKVLTTPDNPEEAVVAGISQTLAMAGLPPSDVEYAAHATTLFTNALIERKGARTALITTLGFRDAIEIAREHRYDMYDLRMERPRPLAARHLRFEIDERVLADGSVRKAPSDTDILAVIEKLKAEKIEAVGVCLIHSYLHPAHEQRVAEILARELPAVAVTISSDLVPEIREYDRTSTTLANVYVKEIAQRYLGRLRQRVRDEVKINSALFIMQSNGGVCEIEAASRYPIRLVESGPAAGAQAAAYFGQLLGHPDLLSFDMGGTTAKACVIADGEPLIAPEFEVDRQYQFKKGSGLPVKIPAIEMIEIGTGGGSIAQVDALRRLQVGPRSAGSKPGPACYGLGGTEPTVTDADLVLGYLDPTFFLGGKMSLDIDGARRALADKIGQPLDLDVAEAAWGVHQLANESMASAARIHAIERGKDVQKFPIFAFGGAGPVHAYGVARILRSPKVLYPVGAGVLSAIGLLTAPLAFDFVRSLPGPLDSLDLAAVNALYKQMESEAREILSRTVPADKITFRRFADMRYRKQGYEIRVPFEDSKLDHASIPALRQSFEKHYRDLYGHTVPNASIDTVSWRLVALGPRPELRMPELPTSGTDAKAAQKGTREIYLADARRFAEVPVYDRYRIGAGTILHGPAVIEERESTVVINGQGLISVDDIGTLSVDLGNKS